FVNRRRRPGQRPQIAQRRGRQFATRAQLGVPAVEIALHFLGGLDVAEAEEILDAKNAGLVLLPALGSIDGGRRRQLAQGGPLVPRRLPLRRRRLFREQLGRLAFRFDERDKDVAGPAFALAAQRKEHRPLLGEAVDAGPAAAVVAGVLPEFVHVDA